MKKQQIIKLALFLVVLLVLAACSEKGTEKESKGKSDKKSTEEIVKTFLMYSETSETEDGGSIGDLYIKTISSDVDKIASNVLNDQYKYIQSNDSVLFLTSDYDLYEYRRGKDKEKIASNVSNFSGGFANNVIFYQNDDDDLYIVNEANESEKIASSVSQIDMVDSDLYYLNFDGHLKMYNVESRLEISLNSNVFYFELLNTDGDFIYTNDDSMLFYKKKDQEAIKISGNEVNSYYIEQVDQSFVYIAYEDEKQVLFQTSIDGLETIKIAIDVDTYEIKGENIIYLTYDDNLFTKKPEDDGALKLASDVSYFSVSDEVIFYADTDNNLFIVTEKGEKTKKASNVETFRITETNELIYGNTDNELFLNDKKLATDVDDYALFANNLAYATDNDKLYFMNDLGEAVVVEEDLSKYSIVTYQNNTIFSNYLAFSDLSGDWEVTIEGERGIFHISADGNMSNDLYGTTVKLELNYAGYNYMEVILDEIYGRIEYNGDSFVLTSEDYEIVFEKITKAEKMAETVNKETEKPAEKTTTEQAAQPEKIDLDTVPVPGAINTVESTRDQINDLVYYYLEAYTDGDTEYLENFVHPSSSFYSDQINYMNSLNSSGVELDLIDYSITAIEEIAANKYKVTVYEDYSIYDPEKGFSEPSQTSHYTVELLDGSFYITAFSF